MKKAIRKTIAIFTAVMTMAIILCCTTVTASAAEIQPVASVSSTAALSAAPVTFAASITDKTLIPNIPNLKMNQDAQQQGQSQQKSGGTVDHTSADSAYEGVVDFIVKWLKRAGLLIAFFGGGMLLLAVKNEDADGKQRGVLTLIAGFGLAALCQSVTIFNLTE